MAARLHKESGRRLFKDLKQTFSTPFKDANQKFAKRQETSSKLLDKLNQMKDNLKN
ncbi:hypothetical protein [Mycoplasmopsis glycophila]|nr:hypothetical protein [Mycoplasmopsis glycophila]VEU70343.1 Uncharacterised protein [Mycoplasmopsis glycophila]